MSWSYAIHELRTGRALYEVVPDSVSWTRRITGSGSGSFGFRLLDNTTVPRAGRRGLFTPNDRVIVVKWNDGHSVFAGVVTSTSYDRTSGMLSVSTVELRSVFARRFAGPLESYGPGWDFDFNNVTAKAAAETIVSRTLTAGTGYELPIVVWETGAAGTFSRKARYYETVTIDDLLSEIEAQGVTIDFNPDLTADGDLAWVMVTGQSLDRGVTSLSVDAPDSPIRGLSVTDDGAKQSNGVLALGKGSGKEMKAGYATSTAGGSARDSKITLKDESNAIALGLAASAEMGSRLRPTEQWSFKVRVSDVVTPWMLRPGRVLDVSVFGDPWIPDGHRDLTVIAISGDGSLFVTPEVQPNG